VFKLRDRQIINLGLDLAKRLDEPVLAGLQHTCKGLVLPYQCTLVLGDGHSLDSHNSLPFVGDSNRPLQRNAAIRE
jgi:hypothetical protein